MHHTINIEKIIPGGIGLGRLDDGLVVLTRYVMPGETVIVRETRKRKGYIEALPVEILEPSPDRVEPPCPYFTRCGGCDFQHMSDPAQHRIKNEIISELLARAHVAFEDGKPLPLLPSPLSYHYRFRIRLQVTEDGRIGFYKSGTNTLVEISNCLVATKLINSFFPTIADSRIFKKIGASIREIELLHSPADDSLTVVLRLHRKKRLPGDYFQEFAASLDPAINIISQKGHFLTSIRGKGPPVVLSHHFNKNICGQPFNLSWDPACFSQVNAEQNCNLMEFVCRMSAEKGGRDLLDLYCGTGNFSIPLGLSGATITGIEHSNKSITWAIHNAKTARLHKFTFQAGDVIRKLIKLNKSNTRFDTILLDPPRQGIGKSTHLITDLAPQNIFYISCDPATLMRDLSVLIDRGYHLSTLAPVDMFPQTHHIETVAILEKN